MRRGGIAIVAVAAAIAVTLLVAFGAGRGSELAARDAALRLMPPRSARATVVVAIDEDSIRRIGKWPWRREVLAQIVDRAADAKAKAVVIDVLLAEGDAGDDKLAAAMKRIPTLIVSVFDEGGGWLAPAPTIHGAAEPAHGNFELDTDGIVRRVASTKQSRDRARTALSLAAASIVTGAPIPVGRSIAPAFRTHPDAIPRIRAADVLSSPAEQLRDKLVFLGPTAHALGDRVLTPVSTTPDPGVTVHAAATESIIRNEIVSELPPILAGLFAGIAVASIVGPRTRAVRLTAGLLFVEMIAIGGYELLLHDGVAPPFATLLLTVIVTTGLKESLVVARSLREQSEEVVRLEHLATNIAQRQAQEAESKRVLAHELKTPLASMRGLSQLLGGYDLTDAERRRVASLLEAEAGKLQAMVTGLLDLERLPLRDFASTTSVLDLMDVVSSRVDLLRAGTDRVISLDATPGVYVRGDAALIERVVDNLVTNALKYSTSAVDVRVSRNAAAVLSVSDHGPGISAADRERLFDRFFRGQTAAGTEGLGLGLALVAEVAQWHGGRVTVTDAAGGGTQFRFVLPLETP